MSLLAECVGPFYAPPFSFPHQAGEALVREGYKVVTIDGGFGAWVGAGLPFGPAS